MEKLTNKFKEELLNAISDIELSYEDFEHCLEDSRYTYARCKKYIETENLNITIEFEEEACWQDYDYYETVDFNVSFLEVTCENGIIDTDRISDTELMKYVNYE